MLKALCLVLCHLGQASLFRVLATGSPHDTCQGDARERLRDALVRLVASAASPTFPFGDMDPATSTCSWCSELALLRRGSTSCGRSWRRVSGGAEKGGGSEGEGNGAGKDSENGEGRVNGLLGALGSVTGFLGQVLTPSRLHCPSCWTSSAASCSRPPDRRCTRVAACGWRFARAKRSPRGSGREPRRGSGGAGQLRSPSSKSTSSPRNV